MTDAVAPQGETTPSTTNAPEGTSAPETSTVQPEAQLFTPEEAIEIKKFLDNNGGLKAIKRNLSLRKADSVKQPQPEVEPPSTEEPSQPANTPALPDSPAEPSVPSVPKGYQTPAEILAQVYNDRLENIPEYEPIRDYIHKGEYIKEMEDMGMVAFDKYGNVNDSVVRKFLDIKAKTVPAPTPSAPLTTTPLVEYTHTEGDITNMETAREIMHQGMSHPRYNGAKAFLATAFNGHSPVQPSQPSQA